MQSLLLRLVALLAGLAVGAAALAEVNASQRIKDLVSIQGVRSNQLVGYGIVVGLDSTGDQTSQAPFTIQSITNMLARFGVPIPAGTNPQLKNVAAVTVTAELPAFAHPEHTPELEFHYDESIAGQDRIERLLNELHAAEGSPRPDDDNPGDRGPRSDDDAG